MTIVILHETKRGLIEPFYRFSGLSKMAITRRSGWSLGHDSVKAT
jgi:hypothetical protein